MLILRILLILACLSTTGWYLHREQLSGRFQHVDDLFLDFLVANGRERLTAAAPAGEDSPVAFVALREEQRGEYAAWPPPALDWQTLFKALQSYEPSLLVIATPLNWGRPAPEFVPAVAESLLPFAQVVQGIEVQLSSAPMTAPPFMGELSDVLPRFQRVEGQSELAPAFSALITAPDPALRAAGEMGPLAATQAKDGWALPYTLRAGGTLVPTLLAQSYARLTRSPYAQHRLRLGPGGGAYLAEGSFIPLQNDGGLLVPADTSVPIINALDLMTGTLADALSSEGKAALGKGKIIVIGPDHEANESPRLAYLHAQAFSYTLRLPKLQKLSEIQQWIAWGIAALGSAWIVLRVRRSRALWAGLALVFTALVLSFLAFQASLLWCPPTLPAALVAVGSLVGMIAGKGHSLPSSSHLDENPTPPQPAGEQ